MTRNDIDFNRCTGTDPCPLRHPDDLIESELARRRTERDAELADLLRDTPPDEHAAVRWDFKQAHTNADWDLLDPGFHDHCPACGASLPHGYLTTTTVTNADGIITTKESPMNLTPTSSDDDHNHVPNLALPVDPKVIFDQILRRTRNIVGIGSGFDYERFLPCRRLMVTVVPGLDGLATHAFVCLSGSPSRGAVSVNLTHDGACDSRHVSSGRLLELEEVEDLRQFFSWLTGKPHNQIPNGFTWISPAE